MKIERDMNKLIVTKHAYELFMKEFVNFFFQFKVPIMYLSEANNYTNKYSKILYTFSQMLNFSCAESKQLDSIFICLVQILESNTHCFNV
jgi:hypothetical protein